MSYNATDLYRMNGVLQKNPRELKALADVIQLEKPDVIALQEAGDKGLLAWFNKRYLQKKYPNIVTFQRGERPGGNVAIMTRPGFKVVHAASHQQEQNKGRYDHKRDFLEVTLETPNQYRFSLFNAHFRSPRIGEEESYPVRKEEAESAARILKRSTEARKLVVGDFNSFGDTEEGQTVIDTVSLKTDRNPDNDLTETSLKATRDGQNPFAATHVKGERLDHMMASPAMLADVKEAYVTGRIHKNPWKLASRHLPVITVLEEPDDTPQPAEASTPSPPPKTFKKGRRKRRGRAY